MTELIRFEAERARARYATGLQLLPMLDRRSAACTGAMAGIYRQLLEHIAASPQTALGQRLSLPGREKAMIAAAALAGIVRPARGRKASGPPPVPAPPGASQPATGQSEPGQSEPGQPQPATDGSARPAASAEGRP